VRQAKGVKSTDARWGRPDIFILVEVSDNKVQGNTVLDKIQTTPGGV